MPSEITLFTHGMGYVELIKDPSRQCLENESFKPPIPQSLAEDIGQLGCQSFRHSQQGSKCYETPRFFDAL